MAQKKVNAKQKPVDNTIYKAMIDMAAVCVCLFLLGFIDRNYPHHEKFLRWMEVFKWLSIGSAVVTVAGVVMCFLKKPVLKTVGIWVAASFAVVAASCFALYEFWYEAIPYLYFLVIAAGALYLIWLLYPHDFFLISLVTTLAGGAFYNHGQGYLGTSSILLYAVLAVLAVGIMVLTHLASRKNGVLSLKGKTIRLYMGKNGAVPLYLTCAILLACIVASVLLGSTFAFYCVYAAVGGLFIAACYYTIRLN